MPIFVITHRNGLVERVEADSYGPEGDHHTVLRSTVTVICTPRVIVTRRLRTADLLSVAVEHRDA